MRISYSCMANLERLIKSHNQRILNKSNLIKNQCNCAGGCKYDLKGGNCRSENIIYTFSCLKCVHNSNFIKLSFKHLTQYNLNYFFTKT